MHVNPPFTPVHMHHMHPTYQSMLSKSLASLVQKPLFLAVKTTCPFCKNAIALAKSHDVEAEVLELNAHKNGVEIQSELTESTGQKTVPYVYSNGKFIGGFTELNKQPASFWKGLQ